MNAAGHYFLNVADFPGSVNGMAAEHHPPRCTQRVGGSAPTKRRDAFFLMGVALEEMMHPADRGRPSLALHCLEKEPFEEGGLRPGGKVLPSLRMDRVASPP